MTTKVSIIIPVFNAEGFLNRCINSVLSQCYKNYELILVDDGSTDKSGIICDAYAKSDNRIKVFHKNNGGVSSARNWGIDHAQGEYIIFIDSDDYVLPDYISNLMKYNSDLNVSGLTYRRKHGKEEHHTPIESTNISKPSIGLLIPTLEYMYLLNGPCQKRFTHKILDQYNIRFDTTISSGEDTIFVLNYITKINSISSISQSNYIYNLCDNGISLSKKRPISYNISYFANKMYFLRKQIAKEFHITNTKYINFIRNTYQSYLYSSIYTLYYNNIEKNERIAFIKELCIESDIFYTRLFSNIKNFVTTLLLKLHLYNLLDILLILSIKYKANIFKKFYNKQV